MIMPLCGPSFQVSHAKSTHIPGRSYPLALHVTVATRPTLGEHTVSRLRRGDLSSAPYRNHTHWPRHRLNKPENRYWRQETSPVSTANAATVTGTRPLEPATGSAPACQPQPGSHRRSHQCPCRYNYAVIHACIRTYASLLVCRDSCLVSSRGDHVSAASPMYHTHTYIIYSYSYIHI